MEDILRTLPLTSRVIVFVEMKESAKILCERLKSLFPELHPAVIVGNTGWEGMNWHEQNEILSNFNRDNASEDQAEDQIRLIVSTSVVEEGLDFQRCDTVFRFGGRGSLIQYIQSRGRARTGKMYIILTEEDRKHIDALQKEEQNLNHAFSIDTALTEDKT